MGLVKLGVDFENPARRWWDGGGRDLWAGISEDPEAASTVCEESIAQSWLEQAQQIPGWFDGPDYAPHPIRLADLDEEDH